jgi:hypothetical protein
MSWKYQVQVHGEAGWHDNAVRFPTKEEADKAGKAKMWAWFAVTDVRTVETPEEPANYNWHPEHGLISIEGR